MTITQSVGLKSMPDVSIIVTVFNSSLYLREAIESVLAQKTSASFEVLIVDDGSTDGSFEIAVDYARLLPNMIHVVHHPRRKNRGISASRNLGLSHASGPIIAFLDADDVWLEHRLESQLPALRSNDEVAMVYAVAERWYDFNLPYDPLLGSSGNNFVPPLVPRGERSGVISPPNLLTWFLEDESMTPCTCTVLVRTSVARSVGGFEAHFTGLYDDQVFFAKVALRERIFVSLECVARYRQHDRSCCAVARLGPKSDGTREMFLAWLEQYKAINNTIAPLRWAGSRGVG